MSNSPLVSYTRISPNRNSPRNASICYITPHCVVGQCSVEALGEVFAPTSRQASSNYGIGWDGRVGMYCPESDRSWCSSSAWNDNKAVTIECASDTFSPYKVNDTVYSKLIDLCVDICQRNGKKKLLWLGSKEATMNYSVKADEMVLTAHRWYASTACPGEYLYSRFGDLADRVTMKLQDKKWVQKPVWYLYQGDKMLTGWQEVKGKWYYLDDNGVMHTGWLFDKGYNGWFLLSNNGDMLTGWQKVKDKWYYLAPATTNSTIKGKMITGWLKDNGKWYYLDPSNGHMYADGTYVIEGKKYTFDKSGALVE